MSTGNDPQAIEIFRPGTHTAMSGAELTFSEADLAACAAAYDPKLHEAPLCVGHPKHDLPAYGWAKAVRFAEGGLYVDPDQVEPAFAEMVKSGRFKKVSAAFFPPNHPSNPKPSVWYLRHVGFLGAQPPAVKGLKPVQFADDGEVVVFGDAPTRRGLVAQAFKLLTAAFGEADDGGEDVLPPAKSPDPKPETEMSDDDVKKREAELAKREAEFAERENKAKRSENTLFLDGLIQAGKFLPARKDRMLAFMDRLDATDVVAFAEGEDGKKTELDELKGFLEASPKLVEFAELAKPEIGGPAGTVAFAAPAGFAVDPTAATLHAKAVAYQSSHDGVDFITAYKAVGGQ